MSGNSIKTGACPFDDGSGYAYDIEVDEQRIWLNKGSVAIDLSDWDEVRRKINAAVSALAALKETTDG